MISEHNPIVQFCESYLKEKKIGEQFDLKLLKKRFESFFKVEKIEKNDWIEVFNSLKENHFKKNQEIIISTVNLLCSTLFHADEKLFAEINYLHGDILSRNKIFDSSVEALFIAKNIFTKHRLIEDIAKCNVKLADIFVTQSKYKEASDLYKITLKEINRNRNDMQFMIGKCKLGISKVYLNQNKYKNALTEIKSAKNIFYGLGDKTSLADCDRTVGSIYYLQGKYDNAVSVIEIARNLYENENNEEGVADCDLTIGLTCWRTQNYDKALELFVNSRNTYKKLKFSNRVASCELNIGNVYLYSGQYNKAIEHYKIAEKIFKKFNILLELAYCKENTAIAFQELGKYNDAILLLKSAVKYYKKENMSVNTADCYLNMGNIYELSSQYRMALKKFLDARKIFQKNNIKDAVADCDNDISNIFVELCDYQKAIEYYESANETFKELKMKPKVAICNMNIAIVYGKIEQYNKAIDLLLEARKILSKKRMIFKIAECDISIAIIYADIGDYKKAIEKYQSAKKIYKNNDMIIDIAKCDLDLASIYFDADMKNYDEMIHLLESAHNIFKEKELNMYIAKCDLILSNIYRAMGNYENAFKLCDSAEKGFIHEKMKSKLDECCLTKALLYEHMGENEKSYDYYHKVNQESQIMSLKIKSNYGMARILFLNGKVKEALSYYKNVIDQIEKIRGDLSQIEHKNSYLRKALNVYTDLIKICIEGKLYEYALESVEQLKSRNLSELLFDLDIFPKKGNATVRYQYKKLRFQIKTSSRGLYKETDTGNSISRQKNHQKLNSKYSKLIEELRKDNPDFDPDHEFHIAYQDINNLVKNKPYALLELYPMEDKLACFIISDRFDIEQSTIFITDFNKSKIDEYIKNLSELYRNYKINKGADSLKYKQQWETYLEQILSDFYQKIFLKIHPFIVDKSELIIIPYSGLHLIPLHAMFTETNGKRKYLIDDYVISYSPSAKILKQCMERTRNDGQKKLIVAHADPNNDLKYSNIEATLISDLFDDSKVLFDINKSDIIKYARIADILHYVGHADLNSLFLCDPNKQNNREAYNLEEIFETLYFEQGDLVVLSACETGITKLDKIDEYIGLPSAFLHAGASTVISSLWSVSDISTTLLMSKMYEFIKAGKGKAESLRQAQLWLKDPANRQEQLEILNKDTNKKAIMADRCRFSVESVDSDEITDDFLPDDLSKPYYWAGFICSGAD